MTDLYSMIKDLRLSWLKRVFSSNKGTWKTYLRYLLKDYGGFRLFSCNYNIKDLSITSQFYKELIQWWSEFREVFAEEKDRRYIIWNNQEIRVNNKPVFYETYATFGIHCVNDLLLDLDSVQSFNKATRNIARNNILIWTGLRHSVPSDLRHINSHHMITNPSFKYSNCLFDVTKKKSKEYYTLLASTKAQLPNHAANLKWDFNFSENQLIQAYSLPHTVTFEPYLRAFQYKVPNSTLYTNAKLFKIGFIEDDKCTFCKQEVETIYHLMFHCFYSKQFWRQFESYFYSITKRQVHLNLRDVLFGIITSKCILLNYLLIIHPMQNEKRLGATRAKTRLVGPCSDYSL